MGAFQTVKENIQEKNQYQKDLESLALKYDATTTQSTSVKKQPESTKIFNYKNQRFI